MADKVLEMHSITKEFPGVRALDGVSFEAYKGEILALCGENGAGKSTLMKILSGSYPASSYEGEIFVDGQRCVFQNAAQSEQSGIAMIYQEISMHLDMSIAENIFLGRWPRKGHHIDWKQLYADAKKYLDIVELAVDPTDTLRNLGTSQQQLVAIARALSKNPKILVLDEPTSPLTSNESDNLFHILRRLKQQGTSSILISHKLDEVFEHSDRITVLRDGKSVSSYPINEADQQQIITDMVGREISTFYPKEAVELGEIVLEAKNFTVPNPYNAKKNIVTDVSFSVRRGEILGLAGLVGAGRSETVNALFGKQAKISGTVCMEGRKIEIRSPIDAIRHGIALVTEERKTDGIIGSHSIQDNEILVALKKLFPRGHISPGKARKVAREYFDRLKIRASDTNMLVEQLSGGNQQKVVLAKWLMDHPRVLILDEPTRGIDVGAKTEIYKIMVDLAKQGTAIIMISSELPELLSMSDRVIVLANGKVSGEVGIDDSITQEKIMEMATDFNN